MVGDVGHGESFPEMGVSRGAKGALSQAHLKRAYGVGMTAFTWFE
jgi:hypothetical protein